jgi:hypothetical protein
MMSVGLHCRLAQPGRVAALAEFLEFALSHRNDVWICTREQIADFWYENRSPRGAGSPVKEPAGEPLRDESEGSHKEAVDQETKDVTADAPAGKDEEPASKGRFAARGSFFTRLRRADAKKEADEPKGDPKEIAPISEEPAGVGGPASEEKSEVVPKADEEGDVI